MSKCRGKVGQTWWKKGKGKKVEEQPLLEGGVVDQDRKEQDNGGEQGGQSLRARLLEKMREYGRRKKRCWSKRESRRGGRDEGY